MTGPSWLRPATNRVRRLAEKRQRRTPASEPGVDAASAVAGEPEGHLAGEAGDLAPGLFVNPIAEGADPWVVGDGDRYLWCQSEGNVAISIWSSTRLHAFGRKDVVWTAPATGPVSKQVWAPELVKLDGRWHIYFAASDGDNRNHRSYVLAARTDDPLGRYDLVGPLFTGDGADDGSGGMWSIDLTVFEHGGSRYAMWSGWPTAHEDVQHLYIAPMASPTLITDSRVCIAQPGAYDWERIDETRATRALLEGPEVLSRGGRTFVVYSCAASWLATYKLGMLELTGTDPLEPTSWTRWAEPVFTSSRTTYGVGHSCFVTSPDQREWWHVFHAKVDRRDGWRRAVHVQPMQWSDEGIPRFGLALPPRRPVTVPSGTPYERHTHGRNWDLTQPGALADFDYYGHHQFFAERLDGVHLGVVPEVPVNAYRTGEKVVLRDGSYADLRVRAEFVFLADHRASGLLFRCTAVGVGYDAQRGYFAGIARDRNALVLGRTDGVGFTSLAEMRLESDITAPQTLTVTASGPEIRVECGQARIEVHDSSYARGSVGLRVVDTHTRFTGLEVVPLA